MTLPTKSRSSTEGKPLIRVKIRSLYAIGLTENLRSKFFSEKEPEIEVEAGARVEELLEEMPFLGPPDSFDDIMIHVFVNGRLQPFDYVLQHNDVLDIHIPVSGG